MAALAALGWMTHSVGVAHADKVVVLPPTGAATQDVLDQMEDALADAVNASEHEALTEARTTTAVPSATPKDANEFRAIADMQGAEWVLTSEVSPSSAGYRLRLRAGYAPLNRVEELEFEVSSEDKSQSERLTKATGLLLRPQGLANETLDGGGKELPAPSSALPTKEPPSGALAANKHSDDWPWFMKTTLRGHGILIHDPKASGGALGAVELRFGRPLRSAPSLELSGGAEIVYGASSGFSLFGSASYYFHPFAHVPVYLGANLDVGLFQALTGNRVPSFLVRAAPVLRLNLSKTVSIEGALPEIAFLSANEGVLTLGGAVRLGFQF